MGPWHDDRTTASASTDRVAPSMVPTSFRLNHMEKGR
ncbi:unnamed protein product [Arabidopsis halleri]